MRGPVMFSHRLFSHASAYPTFTPPSPSPSSPFFTHFSAASVSNLYLHPLFICTSSREFCPNVISGKGMPSVSCNASASAALTIGFVVAVIFQSLRVMHLDPSSSETLCTGIIGVVAIVFDKTSGAKERVRYLATRARLQCVFGSHWNSRRVL